MVALRTLKDERETLLARLSEPFPEEAIERTKGAETRKGYDTSGIKYQYVVDRLNTVLGLEGWRTTAEYAVEKAATKSGRDKYSVVCTLTMQIGDVEEDGVFRVWAERQGTGGHDSVTEADARKGAMTNGLKKVAAMFGVGRQAYAGTLDDDNVPAPRLDARGPRVDSNVRNEVRAELDGLVTMFGGRPAVLEVIGAWPQGVKEAIRAVAKLKAVHAQRVRENGGKLQSVPPVGQQTKQEPPTKTASAQVTSKPADGNRGATTSQPQSKAGADPKAGEPSPNDLPLKTSAPAVERRKGTPTDIWRGVKAAGIEREALLEQLASMFKGKKGVSELDEFEMGDLVGWINAQAVLRAARNGGER